MRSITEELNNIKVDNIEPYNVALYIKYLKYLYRCYYAYIFSIIEQNASYQNGYSEEEIKTLHQLSKAILDLTEDTKKHRIYEEQAKKLEELNDKINNRDQSDLERKFDRKLNNLNNMNSVNELIDELNIDKLLVTVDDDFKILNIKNVNDDLDNEKKIIELKKILNTLNKNIEIVTKLDIKEDGPKLELISFYTEKSISMPKKEYLNNAHELKNVLEKLIVNMESLVELEKINKLLLAREQCVESIEKNSVKQDVVNKINELKFVSEKANLEVTPFDEFGSKKSDYKSYKNMHYELDALRKQRTNTATKVIFGVLFLSSMVLFASPVVLIAAGLAALFGVGRFIADSVQIRAKEKQIQKVIPKIKSTVVPKVTNNQVIIRQTLDANSSNDNSYNDLSSNTQESEIEPKPEKNITRLSYVSFLNNKIEKKSNVNRIQGNKK